LGQLRFIVSKCKVMHIGIRKEDSCMSMMVDGERSLLKKTTLEKDPGIWFSSDLKPSERVAKAVSKANQILGLIRRTSTYMDIPLMKQLLTAKFSYEERLQRMDLPSLEYSIQLMFTKETFKYLHGQYSVDVVSLLMRHDPRGMTTRGHSFKLPKRECHSNIRQNFFSFRVVNMWNSLPEEIVTA